MVCYVWPGLLENSNVSHQAASASLAAMDEADLVAVAVHEFVDDTSASHSPLDAESRPSSPMQATTGGGGTPPLSPHLAPEGGATEPETSMMAHDSSISTLPSSPPLAVSISPKPPNVIQPPTKAGTNRRAQSRSLTSSLQPSVATTKAAVVVAPRRAAPVHISSRTGGLQVIVSPPPSQPNAAPVDVTPSAVSDADKMRARVRSLWSKAKYYAKAAVRFNHAARHSRVATKWIGNQYRPTGGVLRAATLIVSAELDAAQEVVKAQLAAASATSSNANAELKYLALQQRRREDRARAVVTAVGGTLSNAASIINRSASNSSLRGGRPQVHSIVHETLEEGSDHEFDESEEESASDIVSVAVTSSTSAPSTLSLPHLDLSDKGPTTPIGEARTPDAHSSNLATSPVASLSTADWPSAASGGVEEPNSNSVAQHVDKSDQWKHAEAIEAHRARMRMCFSSLTRHAPSPSRIIV